MANTIAGDAQVVNLSALDSDWLSSSQFKGTPKVKYIIFLAAASDERCIIRKNSTTGPIIFDSGKAATAYTAFRVDINEYWDLALVFADGTYANAASMIIIAVGAH
jgi:hypothetical protein